VAGILVDGDRVLVARRRREDHLGGKWEFPGGKIEPGESPAEALARELAEELDLEIRVGPLCGILAHRYPERSVRIRFHFAERRSGEPRAVGCEEFRWVSPPGLLRLSFPEADHRLVAELVRAHREGRPLESIRIPSTGNREEHP
jgi:8-oxo-dGTP diphosphatase